MPAPKASRISRVADISQRVFRLEDRHRSIAIRKDSMHSSILEFISLEALERTVAQKSLNFHFFKTDQISAMESSLHSIARRAVCPFHLSVYSLDFEGVVALALKCARDAAVDERESKWRILSGRFLRDIHLFSTADWCAFARACAPSPRYGPPVLKRVASALRSSVLRQGELTSADCLHLLDAFAACGLRDLPVVNVCVCAVGGATLPASEWARFSCALAALDVPVPQQIWTRAINACTAEVDRERGIRLNIFNFDHDEQPSSLLETLVSISETMAKQRGQLTCSDRMRRRYYSLLIEYISLRPPTSLAALARVALAHGQVGRVDPILNRALCQLLAASPTVEDPHLLLSSFDAAGIHSRFLRRRLARLAPPLPPPTSSTEQLAPASLRLCPWPVLVSRPCLSSREWRRCMRRCLPGVPIDRLGQLVSSLRVRAWRERRLFHALLLAIQIRPAALQGPTLASLGRPDLCGSPACVQCAEFQNRVAHVRLFHATS